MPVVLRYGPEPMPGQADFALLFDHLPNPAAKTHKAWSAPEQARRPIAVAHGLVMRESGNADRIDDPLRGVRGERRVEEYAKLLLTVRQAAGAAHLPVNSPPTHST